MGEAVRVERLAAGGDGVARLADGRAVFVPRTAPGDLVELGPLREYRRYARARFVRLVEPSPDRVPPRCPHYQADDCGGCQLQHLGLGAQLEARRGFVGDALRRIAKREAGDPEIVPADRAFEYRAKLTLTASARARRIGLHRQERAGEVFDLDRCHITRPELMELWQALRQARGLLPSPLERLTLRLDRRGGRHLVLHTGAGGAWTRGGQLRAELEKRGVAATIWWHPEGGAETYPATVFEQVHPEMGDRVRTYAVASLGPVAGLRVWDLYAGIGETTAALSAAGALVESVEADPRAVAEAEGRGPPARRHVGRVEDLVARLEPPHLVITNPPRRGMDAAVTTALSGLGPSRVVYISCDPATLARDLLRLPAYTLSDVRAFDLFPQTAHVETVAVLDRR